MMQNQIITSSRDVYSDTNWRLTRVFPLVVFMMLSTLLLQYFPFIGSFLRESWLLVILIWFALLIIFTRDKQVLGQGYFLAYTVLLCLYPFVSTLTTYYLHDQPIVYGLIASRTSILSAAGCVFIYLFCKKYFSLYEIQISLVAVAWASLFFYTLLLIFVNPGEYVDFAGFAGGSVELGVYYFHYESLFLAYGVFHYFFQFIAKKQTFSLIYMLLFFCFLLFVAERRSITLSIIAVLPLYALYRFKLNKVVPLFVSVAISVVVAYIIAILIFPSDVEYFVEKFSFALNVVFKGEFGLDASANSRILQTRMASTLIEDNIFFGNGLIATSWNDGYDGLMGGRFYPSDIGVFGAIFSYGFVGVAFLSLQLIFPFYWYKKIKRRYVTLSEPLIIFCAFYCIFSIFSGVAYFRPYMLMFLSSIFYCIYFAIKNQKN